MASACRSWLKWQAAITCLVRVFSSHESCSTTPRARQAMGVSFVKGWYDASLILVITGTLPLRCCLNAMILTMLLPSRPGTCTRTSLLR